jgi:hypothetical protein
MSEPSDSNDDILLSAELIKQWIEQYESLSGRKDEITKKIQELNGEAQQISNELVGLQHKMATARPFSRRLQEWLQQQEDNNPETIALTDAILKTLLKFPPGAMINREHIKSFVSQTGYPSAKLQANPNYFYIALKRLTDRGLIAEAPPGNFKLTDAGRAETTKPR